MKIALITDTHAGVRNDAPEFIENTKKFVENIWLPTLEDRGIRRVVHLGDILDRRKFIAFSTSHHLWNDFLEPTMDLVDEFDLIHGNHDELHKNSVEITGPIELLRHYSDSIRWWTNPAEVEIDGTKILYLPWINDANREQSLEMIKGTKAQICFGHLELEGFEMYRGQVCEEGMSASLFNKFDVTCSGHFHHKSSKNGIHYLGSHGQFTWADYNDERGFHIFDTKTRELEFIENPFTMFEKVHYDEGSSHVPNVEGKHVKVIVQKRDDQILFEQFISEIERCNPADLQVVDDHLNSGDLLDIEDEIDESEDTLSVIKKILANGEDELDHDMEKLVTSIYEEALLLES